MSAAGAFLVAALLTSEHELLWNRKSQKLKKQKSRRSRLFFNFIRNLTLFLDRGTWDLLKNKRSFKTLYYDE